MAVDEASLRAALVRYDEALRLREERDKTAKQLVELDGWMRSQLGPELRRREADDEGRGGGAYVTRDELSRLMRWKLARGSWRPKLQSLVDSLDDDLVRETSRRAFALLPPPSSSAASRLATKTTTTTTSSSTSAPATAGASVCSAAASEPALAALTKPLAGVGCATASALLSLLRPAELPFMSDEAMVHAVGMPKAYAARDWRRLCEAMQARARDEGWGERDGAGRGVTGGGKDGGEKGAEGGGVEALERAAWSFGILAKYGDGAPSKAGGGAKRKSQGGSANGEEHSEAKDVVKHKRGAARRGAASSAASKEGRGTSTADGAGNAGEGRATRAGRRGGGKK